MPIQIVAVKNGYIDLKTQQLIEPDKSLYITKKMNVTYDKEAKAPRFEKFLRGIILSRCNEDKELRTDLDAIEFLFKWFGYGMTAPAVPLWWWNKWEICSVDDPC